MEREQYYTDKNYIKKLYRLMYIAHNIFVKNRILYYVTGGTLLGAVRHMGIIPWDDDLDVEIGHRDVVKLLSKSVREEFRREGYKVVDKRGTYGWIKIIHIGSGIQPDMDVFPVEIYKGRAGAFRTRWTFQIGKQEWPHCFYNIKNLFPLKEYRFGKIYVLGPRNPQPALTSCYRSSWKTKGYITMDAHHRPLEKPILVKTGQFTAGKDFYTPPKTKPQIRLKPDSLYLKGIALSFL